MSLFAFAACVNFCLLSFIPIFFFLAVAQKVGRISDFWCSNTLLLLIFLLLLLLLKKKKKKKKKTLGRERERERESREGSEEATELLFLCSDLSALCLFSVWRLL